MVSHSKPSVATICAELPTRGATLFTFWCDRHTLEGCKKDSFNFPLCKYTWQNGLTNSETSRCPDADETERLRGFRPGGREVWRLGPLGHPGSLPRSSLRPAWWKWRKVYGVAWKHPGEHINVVELRAVINGVLWRLRSASNIHSKGVLGFNDDLVNFGTRAFRIAAPRAIGHEVQFAYGRSIFHPIHYSCIAGRTSIRQMGPVAMASNHQRGALGKARRKRLRTTIGLVRDRLIAPRTLVKYRASTAAFFGFCSNAGHSKPHTATEMDLRLCEFVQHTWEEGDSRNIPADARSGLIHFIDAPREAPWQSAITTGMEQK